MIPWETISPYLAPAGLTVLVMTFILRLRTQYRREAMRQRQTDAAREEAAESSGLTNNGGRGLPRQPSRLVKAETPFTGHDNAYSPAQWEIEIDALGRQVIGQIQSKMVALQTLLLETERMATRVELILEKLETSGSKLAKQTQQAKTTDHATTSQDAARQEMARQEIARQEIARQEIARQEIARQDAARQEMARQDAARQEATRQEATRQEMARQEAARQEASHLRAVAQQLNEMPPFQPPVASSVALPVAPQLSIARHAPEPKSDPSPLSIEALFQEFEMPQRPPLTTRGVSGGGEQRRSEYQSNVTLLANYGYSPREIAARLDTSVGEVESLLKATG